MKPAMWRRITMEDSAWRFNRYAERAREAERDAPSTPSADEPEFDPDDEKNWAP